MKERSEILSKSEQFALDSMKSDNPGHLVYHSIGHTQDVVKSSIEIGKQQGLPDDQMEMLEIAAWFHDLGYAAGKEGHEERSAAIAREFLTGQDYPEDRIKEIEACILATRMPQQPTTNLGQIICDADLLHLASDDYFDRAERLRKEMTVVMDCEISDEKWMEMNSDFLDKHCFFTKYAQSRYGEKVKANLSKVNQRLNLWRKATK